MRQKLNFSKKEYVRNFAVNFLEKELGWKKRELHEITREDDRIPILEDELQISLRNLNLGISEFEIQQTISEIKTGCFFFKKLSIQDNREKYLLIKDGFKFWGFKKIKIIDFDSPENNLFTVVSQLEIKWPQVEANSSCSPDLIGFVNGIPLLFAEFEHEKTFLRDIYEQNYSKKYLQRIPQLFLYNAFCVISNGEESKVGAVESKFEFFNDWHRLSENDEGDTRIDTLLKGICDKNNFLDLLENFILFRWNNTEIVKMIARNHQFLGVNLAFESYKKEKFKKEK